MTYAKLNKTCYFKGEILFVVYLFYILSIVLS